MKSILICLEIQQIPCFLWLVSRNHLLCPHPHSAEEGRDWKWEVYLLLTTKPAVAITFSCKANMLEKVTIYCDSSALGPTTTVDYRKPLKIWRKIALWLMSGGHVQTQLQLGAGTKKQKLQARKVSGWVQVRISPFSRLSFGRKWYWKRELLFSNDNTRFWN